MDSRGAGSREQGECGKMGKRGEQGKRGRQKAYYFFILSIPPTLPTLPTLPTPFRMTASLKTDPCILEELSFLLGAVMD